MHSHVVICWNLGFLWQTLRPSLLADLTTCLCIRTSLRPPVHCDYCITIFQILIRDDTWFDATGRMQKKYEKVTYLYRLQEHYMFEESLEVKLPVSVFFYLFVYGSTIYLSICLSVNLFVDLPVYLSICLSVYLSIYLSLNLSIDLSVYPSIYLTNYLSTIFLPTYLSIYPSIHPAIYLSTIYLSIHPCTESIYLFTCLAINIRLSLSIIFYLPLSIYQ